MRAVLRIGSLFAAYSLIGFGGDYAVGLLASDEAVVGLDREIEIEIEIEQEIEVEADVQVLVRTGGRCAFELDRRLTFPVSPGDLLDIEAGAGSLTVEGREGLEEVVVVGSVCASERELLDELRLTIERDGAEIELAAHYPRRGGDGPRTARIDVSVEVPMGMDVDIEDSSGDIQVRGVGNLEIEDSSGEILVAGAAGRVDIDDSSGAIELTGVAGDVHIEDGSSGIELRAVAGDVEIEDGSGSMDLSDVSGDVRIEDGGGSIRVRNIAGDFVVERDGSGGISHSNVGGAVRIPTRRGR